MALMLLLGGGLLIQSFWSLLAVNPGFDPRNVLHMSVFLGPPNYRTVPAQKAYVTRALEGMEHLPGIVAVASVTAVPIADSSSSVGFQIEGRPVPAGEAPAANYRAISDRYFEAMGIPILRGRGVQPTDGEESQLVVVINEIMARRFWPNADPVGQRLRWTQSSDDQGWLTVIGVVGNVKSDGLHTDEPPAVYAPYGQREFPWLRWTSFVVRSESDPQAQVAAVRTQLLEVDPNQPVYAIATLEDTVDRSIADRRLNALLLSLFAVVGVVLASIGLYGVVSYSVVQRTHEVGVRLALGARRRDVLTMVLRQGLGLTVLGLLLGLGGALALTRYLDSLLFGVTPTDATTFLTVPLLLLAIALLACYVPARRATSVDPLIALRTD